MPLGHSDQGRQNYLVELNLLDLLQPEEELHDLLLFSFQVRELVPRRINTMPEECIKLTSRPVVLDLRLNQRAVDLI